MLEQSNIAKIAYKLLDDLEKTHKKGETFSDEILLELHSVFGESFVKATQLLEKCKIFEYRTASPPNNDNLYRQIYKIRVRNEQYTIFRNLNYCQCEDFRKLVVENNEQLFCEHVLAFKLNDMLQLHQPSTEIISDFQFIEFLNDQINDLEQK